MNIIEGLNRQANVNRTDVLEHVKALLMFEPLGMLSARQVADYYEAPYITVQQCLARHKDRTIVRFPGC